LRLSQARAHAPGFVEIAQASAGAVVDLAEELGEDELVQHSLCVLSEVSLFL